MDIAEQEKRLEDLRGRYNETLKRYRKAEKAVDDQYDMEVINAGTFVNEAAGHLRAAIQSCRTVRETSDVFRQLLGIRIDLPSPSHMAIRVGDNTRIAGVSTSSPKELSDSLLQQADQLRALAGVCDSYHRIDAHLGKAEKNLDEADRSIARIGSQARDAGRGRKRPPSPSSLAESGAGRMR